MVNGEWWNRVDFSAGFNEYVRRENPMLSIEKVPLRVMAVDNMGKEIYHIPERNPVSLKGTVFP